jgi:hypothetical protein
VQPTVDVEHAESVSVRKETGHSSSEEWEDKKIVCFLFVSQ